MIRTKALALWRKGVGDKPGFAWLFASLFFFMLSYPIVKDRGSLILDLLFSAMLVMSAYAVSHQRKVLVAALMLALPTLFFWWGVRVMESIPFVFVGLALSAIFFMFILFVLLHHVIHSDRANTGTIYAAMCAYLLLGVTWSFFMHWWSSPPRERSTSDLSLNNRSFSHITESCACSAITALSHCRRLDTVT